MFYVKKVIFLGLGNTHTHTHTTDTHADTLIHSLCPQTWSLSVGSHGYFWPSALGFCLESAVLSCFAWFLRYCSREGWGWGSAVCRALLIAGGAWKGIYLRVNRLPPLCSHWRLGASGLAGYCAHLEAFLSGAASSHPLRIPGAGQVIMLSLFFQSGWGNQPCIHSSSVLSHLCLHPNVFLKRLFIPNTK